MKTYKSKSLVSHKTDEQIEREGGVTRFISFESAIQLFRQHYGLMELKDAPIGYRVTEQGIEIVFE
jgi:hypothetical protein